MIIHVAAKQAANTKSDNSRTIVAALINFWSLRVRHIHHKLLPFSEFPGFLGKSFVAGIPICASAARGPIYNHGHLISSINIPFLTSKNNNCWKRKHNLVNARRRLYYFFFNVDQSVIFEIKYKITRSHYQVQQL